MDTQTLTEAQLFVTTKDLREFLDYTCAKYNISYRDKIEWIRLDTEFIKRIGYERDRLQREYRDQLLTSPTIESMRDLVAAINSKSLAMSDISAKADRIVKLYESLKNGGHSE